MKLLPPFGVWAFTDRLAVLCPGWPENTIVADNVVSRDAARAIAALPELLELHRFLALGPGDGDTRPLMWPAPLTRCPTCWSCIWPPALGLAGRSLKF